MLSSALATGFGIFLASAIGLPLLEAYDKWKADPDRVKVARRNWRGQWVPDLGIIRIERAVKATLVALLLLGMAINFVIMGVIPS